MSILNNIRIIAVCLALTFSGTFASAKSRPECVNDPTRTLAQFLQLKKSHLGFSKIPKDVTIVSGAVRVRIDYPTLTHILLSSDAYHSFGLRPPYVDAAACAVRDQVGTLWFVFALKNEVLLYVHSTAGTMIGELVPVISGNDQRECKEESRMIGDTLDKRGKELRMKFQQTYEELAGADKLRGGLHGTDVTSVVLAYIPVGTPFGEAEAILRSAGFVVGPHPGPIPPPNSNRPKDWYAVVAKIAPFSTYFPDRSDLYVSLLPDSPEHYTRVADLYAQFFGTLP